jgi:peptidyl-tRNA hydrolase
MKDREYVQYIIVRKDLVEDMGIGKTAAQVAHASLAVLLEDVPNENGQRELYHSARVQEWLRGRFTKLVVYTKSKQKLLNLKDKLDEEAIRNKPIYDACFTKLEPEEENGTTLTCVGLIPLKRSEIPKFLVKLRLLD